jgi:hypothetical protein
MTWRRNASSGAGEISGKKQGAKLFGGGLAGWHLAWRWRGKYGGNCSASKHGEKSGVARNGALSTDMNGSGGIELSGTQ